MDAGEIAEFEARPHHADAVQVRRWDDAAKNPEGPVLPIDRVLAALASVSRGQR
jgi:gamma-butyrobetaine dioxygenase